MAETKPKPWTVMLYMAATVDDFPEIDARTEQAALRDIRELEQIGTVDETVNVVVQINRRWPAYAQRYCVRKGWSELLGPFPDGAKIGRFFKTGEPQAFGDLYTTNCRAADEFGRSDRNDQDALRKFLGTGNPNVLRDFVVWSQESFPSKRSLLVLWGHAYGLGFGRDHHDPLTMPELASALKGCHIDVLGTNACAMSYAEAVYELRNSAEYLVASEIAMPFKGWPYQRILAEIDNNPEIDARDLSGRIVDDFMDSYEHKGVALTALDLKSAEGLKELIDTLAQKLELAIADKKHATAHFARFPGRTGDTPEEAASAAKVLRAEIRRRGPANQLDEKVKHLAKQLSEAIRERRAAAPIGVRPHGQEPASHATSGSGTKFSSLMHEFDSAVRDRNRKQIAEAFLDTAHGDNRPLIDLVDLCQFLTYSRDDAVQAAANALLDFPKKNGLIVRKGVGSDLEHLNGLGIFAPAVTTLADRKALELDRARYKQLQLAEGNAWTHLVYDDLQDLVEDETEEVAEFVRSTGATDSEAQAAIGDLTNGVFRAFERLAEALQSTKLTVMPVLSGSPSKAASNAVVLREVKADGAMLTDPKDESDTSKLVHDAVGQGMLEQADVNAILADSVVTGIPYALSPAARQRVNARLAPPFLRLAAPLEFVGENGSGSKGAAKEQLMDPRLRERFDDILTSVQDLENALANAEKTVTRALTHARFGVGGPGKSSGEGGPGKSSGEGGPGKSSGEGGPGKSSGEGGPGKSAGEGTFPLILASRIDIADIRGAGEMKSVTALYEQVAISLQQLERSAAKLEDRLRTALTDPAVGVDPKDGQEREQYRKYAIEQVERSFQEFDDMLTDSRQTTVEVVMHPVFGLGPGPDPGLGAAARQRLALAAGLGSRSLRLL